MEECVCGWPLSWALADLRGSGQFAVVDRESPRVPAGTGTLGHAASSHVAHLALSNADQFFWKWPV